ncbi:MAG: hypothetical protein O3A63_11460, partial [Proteobacteria bacterium]|nr:hypothetical protein [Pseudomonadota bacterium]
MTSDSRSADLSQPWFPRQAAEKTTWTGLTGSAQSLCATRTARNVEGPTLIICRSGDSAARWLNEISF